MEFKPKKIDKIAISIRLDSDLLELVDQLSYNAHISRNEFISQSIEFAIKNMHKK